MNLNLGSAFKLGISQREQGKAAPQQKQGDLKTQIKMENLKKIAIKACFLCIKGLSM